MNKMQDRLEEIRSTILKHEQTYFFSPMNQETLVMVKSDVQSFLNRLGYTDDDIEVIAQVDEIDPSIVKVQLKDKSPKGKELLIYISNQS